MTSGIHLTDEELRQRPASYQHRIQRLREKQKIESELRRYYNTMNEEQFVDLMMEKFYYNSELTELTSEKLYNKSVTT